MHPGLPQDQDSRQLPGEEIPVAGRPAQEVPSLRGRGRMGGRAASVYNKATLQRQQMKERTTLCCFGVFAPWWPGGRNADVHRPLTSVAALNRALCDITKSPDC